MALNILGPTFAMIASNVTVFLLPPANIVCEGNVFTPVCDSVNMGGVHGEGGMHGKGGHAWRKGGCMRGEGGGHAWYARPLRDMAGQCAGGTHPTGMHSCTLLLCVVKTLNY